ncbi:MAG: NAD-dependent epimerase/dehydratase family protein [Candidatus Thermoplasmatota archaeon]|nr:NAD-dependent epimerase/dehydratase family protein [Candidatus Thermoplasmatota archaeon]
MEVLVLGGSRFVGLRLVKLLVEKGHQVSTLNRGRQRQPFDVDQIVADRRRPQQVRDALERGKFDVAFDISAYKPSDTVPAVDALEGRVDRFIHLSTAAVYNPKVELPWREDSTRSATAVWGDYASNKIRCESFLFKAHEERGFPAVILRPPYVYGPHNYLYREAYFFDRIEAGRPLLIPDGDAVLQLSHVDDLAMAFLAAATRSGTEGEAINVAGEDPLTFGELAAYAGDAVGADARLVPVGDRHEIESLFPFGNFSLLVDLSKARNILALRPRTMKDGLRDTYEWYEGERPFGPPDFSEDDRLLKGRV